MIDLTRLYKSLAVALSASLAVGAVGCGTDAPTVTPPDQTPPPDPGDPAPPAPPAVFAKRPSKSSTIAISPDDSIVAMVNPDDGSISVFQTSDNSRLSKVATGKNPSSIVIAGDGTTAYVANRDDNTVARVVDIDGGTPKVDKRLDVGSSPVGLALSPSGLKLFVAEFAESNISVIDTQTMMVIDKIPFDRPKALVVTNNGDESDDDEILVGAKFYGLPVAGKEAKDDGRTGQIVTWPLTALHTGTKLNLAPFDSGFPNAVVPGKNVITSPNQLASMAVANNHLYITSVSASPEGPAKFDQNVYPVVHVVDLTTNAEETDTGGTANLALKVKTLIPTPTPAKPRFIPGDLSDIAFLDNTNVAYVVGRAGDVMLRLVYDGELKIGADQSPEIDLLNPAVAIGCQGPTGMALSKTLQRAYVNCWVNRRLGVVDLKFQTLDKTVEASAAPQDADGLAVQAGKRFYFTGRARWSNAGTNGARGGEGWSSCGSCHPDGLSDNITWIFGSGPRQTTSMDGSFSHSPGVGPQKQRVFNWTAVNDEIHDFEANTRGVSGGLGAIVTLAKTTNAPADCNKLDQEIPVAALNAPLVASNKDLADDATIAVCPHKDWDNITAFVKTIAPTPALKSADASAIDRGKTLFADGGCANCHGGSGWTVSRRFYKPADQGNKDLSTTTLFTAPTFSGWVPTFAYDVDKALVRRAQISAQPSIADDTTPGEPTAIAVAQVACVLRNVGTFGIPGGDATSVTATSALEVRAAAAATTPATARAEGRGGYNVPSLYSLALGAPYLHHGQAPTLEDLFTNPKWASHTNAGAANFSSSTLSDPGAVADLKAYLLSIDATTTEVSVPTRFDICPGNPGQSL
jgi:YVTN family beta-propeller protein